MLSERVVPQSEVIRAILLEDSPCCGVPHLGLGAEGLFLEFLMGTCDHTDLCEVVAARGAGRFTIAASQHTDHNRADSCFVGLTKYILCRSCQRFRLWRRPRTIAHPNCDGARCTQPCKNSTRSFGRQFCRVPAVRSLRCTGIVRHSGRGRRGSRGSRCGACSG